MTAKRRRTARWTLRRHCSRSTFGATRARSAASPPARAREVVAQPRAHPGMPSRALAAQPGPAAWPSGRMAATLALAGDGARPTPGSNTLTRRHFTFARTHPSAASPQALSCCP